MARIPTTILTGFLGAGKTTLLNRILQEPHGFRIAVIENEFGPENIDNEILVQDSTEQIIEMNNGCICCSVRGDLIVGLTELARRRDAGEIVFDHLVIETTGLANPGPVAQTFFVDDAVASHYVLDAVITVVDAKHAMQQLDAHEVAQRQVGFADRILISKIDLISELERLALTSRIKRINPRAAIGDVAFGKAPIAEILDIRGFHLNDKLDIDPAFLQADEAEPHGHECPPGHASHDHHHSHHDDDIKAFVFRSGRSFDTARLDDFLGGIVQVYGPRMLRYKGVIAMDGAERKVVFQGVHQMMGSDIGARWGADEKRESKLVFIGSNLPEDIFIRGLEQCLV
ncbi:G3E family GTPase [Actimicrobium sp. GrIS 1.19]|uniref:CobW family GTP-binding protein n=1 Tax=Actimicrobium sp. GrIS 1.19 TaxID=3071708 RepID=UPI002E0B484E|nr:G3E family GTPase [Actimicrobium sp. GrIS 1.19]